VDSAGSIYVTGYVGLPGRLRDLWVSKLDPTTPVLTDASPAWPITLNVPTASTGYGSGIALDPQDNIVVAGAMTGPQGTTDAYLAKIAVGSTAVADGTVLWARTIDGGEQDDDLFTGVLVDPSGNLWATGGVDRPTGAFLNIWIAEFAADGSTLFSMDQDGTGHDDDIGHGIVRDAQGILYLAGETNKSGIGRIMFVERLHWYPSQAPGTSAASPGFKAAPNPYKPGHGGPQDAAGITFGPVDPGSTVRIYTITGSLVAEVTDGDGDGIIVWNAKSPNGAGAASGVYLYVVIPPKGAPFRGKVVIVR
jgi:hypothetical protein